MAPGALLRTLSEAPVSWLRGERAPLTEREVSQSISFARITLMIGLVCLHYGAYPDAPVSPFNGFDPLRHQVATFINSFVLFFFFSSVPMLSMVSGWLYFGFRTEQATGALAKRIRSRVGSLYLPLVFWNVLYLLVAVALFHLAPGYSVLGKLNIGLETAGWLDYVNAMFGLTRHPLAFQFWFVRDLLVTVFLSPVLWLALRRAPLLGAVVLGGSWLIGHDLWIFFRTDVPFFFYLGALLRTRNARLHVSGGAAVSLMAGYMLLVALRTLAPLWLDLSAGRPEWLEVATRGMRLVGVVACWGLCQHLVSTRFGRFAAGYGGLAFFLFATHFPLIAVVKEWLWPLVPGRSDAWLIAHYVASVACTLVLCLGTALTLARLAPGWFALMNGGRVVPVGGGRKAPGIAPVPRQALR